MERIINESEIKKIAHDMRLDIVEMCYRLKENGAHLGGCMSLVELMVVLFKDYLKYNPLHLSDEKRDRVIMSKGQGSIAMYAAMRQIGLIKDLSKVHDLLGEGNIYFKQSVRNKEQGIEFSSGSLGQGLAYGIGIAIALKKKGNDTSNVYVFLGDGECDEGSVWEAASLASHLKLDNLTVIVDKNGLQIDGATKEINCMDSLEDRWRAFGFDTVVIDGHNVHDIYKAYDLETGLRTPKAIIANTVKGKGISFAENIVEWHQNTLTNDLYLRALEDLEKENVQ